MDGYRDHSVTSCGCVSVFQDTVIVSAFLPSIMFSYVLCFPFTVLPTWLMIFPSQYLLINNCGCSARYHHNIILSPSMVVLGI